MWIMVLKKPVSSLFCVLKRNMLRSNFRDGHKKHKGGMLRHYGFPACFAHYDVRTGQRCLLQHGIAPNNGTKPKRSTHAATAPQEHTPHAPKYTRSLHWHHVIFMHAFVPNMHILSKPLLGQVGQMLRWQNDVKNHFRYNPHVEQNADLTSQHTKHIIFDIHFYKITQTYYTALKTFEINCRFMPKY